MDISNTSFSVHAPRAALWDGTALYKDFIIIITIIIIITKSTSGLWLEVEQQKTYYLEHGLEKALRVGFIFAPVERCCPN